MNYYEILGLNDCLPEEVTPEQIKLAYRRKAQETHPDKPGGSDEAFQKVQKAYECLMDPVKKLAYDETGGASEEEVDPIEQSTVNLILETMQANNFEPMDYVNASDIRAGEFVAVLISTNTRNKKDIKRYEKCLNGMAGSKLLEQRLKAMIKALEDDVAKNTSMIEQIGIVRERLSSFKWTGEMPPTYAESMQALAKRTNRSFGNFNFDNS